MKPREAALVFLLVAAAFAAAFTLDVATHPRAIHDPRHAADFARAREALPLLGAVRVRSDLPHAAHRLATAPGRDFLRVLAPARAEAVFRYGRLLYASPPQVSEALAQLERGEVPALPPPPDIGRYYRDARGPYACDVILREGASVGSIRRLLPDARLAGEPVVVEEEERAARPVPHAYILALAAVCAWAAWRTGVLDMQQRLLAALLPVVVLGLGGWGIDAATLAALVLAAAVPQGWPLLAALPCLFFPSLALHRVGIALLVGGCVRWAGARTQQVGLEEGRRPRRGGSALLLVVLLGVGWLLLAQQPLGARVPAALRGEPAATFVPRDQALARAEELRRAGWRGVVGDDTPVPPEPSALTRRQLHNIFHLATLNARKSQGERRERFEEVAEAAALEGLFLPPELRVRLRTTDGRAVLWIQEDPPLDRDDFMSARLYRLRGELQLREEGRLGALLAFLLAGGWLCYRRGNWAALALAARFAGVAAAFGLLWLGETHGAALPAEVLAPLLVVTAFGPSLHGALGLGAAAAVMPQSYLWPALALALAAACAWLGDLSRR
ncbi:MAG: hypothetical protein ACYTEZ_03420 [Planctomycetota bacterium]|jgi:hypothetical protein